MIYYSDQYGHYGWYKDSVEAVEYCENKWFCLHLQNGYQLKFIFRLAENIQELQRIINLYLPHIHFSNVEVEQ